MASEGLKMLAETGDSAALVSEGEAMGFNTIAEPVLTTLQTW